MKRTSNVWIFRPLNQALMKVCLKSLSISRKSNLIPTKRFMLKVVVVDSPLRAQSTNTLCYDVYSQTTDTMSDIEKWKKSYDLSLLKKETPEESTPKRRFIYSPHTCSPSDFIEAQAKKRRNLKRVHCTTIQVLYLTYLTFLPLLLVRLMSLPKKESWTTLLIKFFHL